jgi:hypothetical protein
VDALGPVLEGVVQVVSEIVQPPTPIAAQSALAAASLAVQAHADVFIDGRTYPTSLYQLSIADSGDRKTAVDKLLLQPHAGYQRRLTRDYKAQKQTFENAKMAYEKARDEAVKRAKDRTAKEEALSRLGPPPEEPLAPQLTTGDATIEGLMKLLIRRPSLGVFSNEGARFLGGHAMQPDAKVRTLGGLSELWDGTPSTRTRAGDGSIVLYGRRVALHLMAQPVVAEALLADPIAVGQGFLPRCLLAWPESKLGHQTYVAKDPTEDPRFRLFHDRMTNLLERPFVTAEKDRMELVPTSLPLAPDAKTSWVLFHNWVQKNLGTDGVLRRVSAFAGKAAEHVLRLGGVLAVVQNSETARVELCHVEAGIVLVRYYLSEALRLADVSATRTGLVEASKLLGWFRTRGTLVCLATVYQLGPTFVRDKEKALRLLGVLEDHGWVRRLAGGAKVDGVRRRDVWEVRP